MSFNKTGEIALEVVDTSAFKWPQKTIGKRKEDLVSLPAVVVIKLTVTGRPVKSSQLWKR